MKKFNLTPTSGDDKLIGSVKSNELLDGGLGNDILTGGKGGDQFVYHFDGSNDVITDFDEYTGDRLVLDSGAGVYSGILHLGKVSDGMVLSNHLGTAHFFIETGDFNGDGVLDTQITSDYAEGSITLLGVTDFYGYGLLGG